jgi:hypothetical protein
MADDEQTLHRQVHPSWVQDGRITSQAFSPTPKDAGLLSVYDGKQIAAEPSFIHYTTVQKLTAIGTVSVTAGEATSVGLPWRPDPEPFPEHAVIDYTELPTPGKIKAKAQALAERARQRGWTYTP